jgi:hypothetical protein
MIDIPGCSEQTNFKIMTIVRHDRVNPDEAIYDMLQAYIPKYSTPSNGSTTIPATRESRGKDEAGPLSNRKTSRRQESARK